MAASGRGALVIVGRLFISAVPLAVGASMPAAFLVRCYYIWLLSGRVGSRARHTKTPSEVVMADAAGVARSRGTPRCRESGRPPKKFQIDPAWVADLILVRVFPGRIDDVARRQARD